MPRSRQNKRSTTSKPAKKRIPNHSRIPKHSDKSRRSSQNSKSRDNSRRTELKSRGKRSRENDKRDSKRRKTQHKEISKRISFREYEDWARRLSTAEMLALLRTHCFELVQYQTPIQQMEAVVDRTKIIRVISDEFHKRKLGMIEREKVEKCLNDARAADWVYKRTPIELLCVIKYLSKDKPNKFKSIPLREAEHINREDLQNAAFGVVPRDTLPSKGQLEMVVDIIQKKNSGSSGGGRRVSKRSEPKRPERKRESDRRAQVPKPPPPRRRSQPVPKPPPPSRRSNHPPSVRTHRSAPIPTTPVRYDPVTSPSSRKPRPPPPSNRSARPAPSNRSARPAPSNRSARPAPVQVVQVIPPQPRQQPQSIPYRPPTFPPAPVQPQPMIGRNVNPAPSFQPSPSAFQPVATSPPNFQPTSYSSSRRPKHSEFYPTLPSQNSRHRQPPPQNSHMDMDEVFPPIHTTSSSTVYNDRKRTNRVPVNLKRNPVKPKSNHKESFFPPPPRPNHTRTPHYHETAKRSHIQPTNNYSGSKRSRYSTYYPMNARAD